MPEKLLHRIEIAAPPERVWDALTTRDGIAGWWTTDCDVPKGAGSVAVFGFYERATVFRMRIDESVRPKRLAWACVGDFYEWIGTRVEWDLVPTDGGTDVRLAHLGWRSAGGWFASCNTTWGELLYRLAAYAEGKSPGPLFAD